MRRLRHQRNENNGQSEDDLPHHPCHARASSHPESNDGVLGHGRVTSKAGVCRIIRLSG